MDGSFLFYSSGGPQDRSGSIALSLLSYWFDRFIPTQLLEVTHEGEREKRRGFDHARSEVAGIPEQRPTRPCDGGALPTRFSERGPERHPGQGAVGVQSWISYTAHVEPMGSSALLFRGRARRVVPCGPERGREGAPAERALCAMSSQARRRAPVKCRRPRSILPQGGDGVEARGLPCREESEEDAHGH